MDLEYRNPITLTEPEIERYARHILLPEVGGTGQMRLKSARVLIAGAGGLGSPLILYLAAAGIGTLGIVDDDQVELSNLQRQIAHPTASLGHPKVASAAATARALNPHVTIESHPIRLTAANAQSLAARYDLVCDGTDNFETRFIIADACLAARKTLISAAVHRYEAQLSTFKPHAAPTYPCYRCLHPAPPPPDPTQSCAESGILGAVVGVAGTLQATEVLKEILGIGETLAGRLLIWDALATRFRVIQIPRDPACPACAPLHA